MSVYKPGRPVKYTPSTSAGNKPPALPGEYRIRSADSGILYIGETDDLLRRMGEHVRSGKLAAGCSFEYQTADGRSSSRTRREHERAKIKQHQPPLNKSKGGEGRPAGR